MKIGDLVEVIPFPKGIDTSKPIGGVPYSNFVGRTGIITNTGFIPGFWVLDISNHIAVNGLCLRKLDFGSWNSVEKICAWRPNENIRETEKTY